MHPAAKLQFARVVDEFVKWRRIEDDDRPPAPAWWWGPAFEFRNIDEPMPPRWCRQLGLRDGATYAAGAEVLRTTLTDQTIQPWPYDFSHMVISPDSDVRDLQPQPSDDSAFSP